MSNPSTQQSDVTVSSGMVQMARIIAMLLVIYFGLAFLVFIAETGGESASIKSYPQALWYTLVTFSTVGYGDVYPTTTFGKIIGSLTIICSVGLIGYTVGKLGEQILENNRRKFLGMNGTKFRNHYLIVGWSEVSRIVISEILSAGFKAALLTDNESDITEIRSVFDDENLFISYGLLENEGSYRKLNIDEAAGAILLCDDDTRTLIIVLHLREIRPDLKITAYIHNSRLRRTVENAGVSYVVSPNEVIGRMIASATFEPDVSVFLEDLLSTTTADDDLDVQEYQLTAGHELVGRTVNDANGIIAQQTGARLLTYSRCVQGRWEISKNTDGTPVLQADDYLIVIASFASANHLASYLGVGQGRRG